MTKYNNEITIKKKKLRIRPPGRLLLENKNQTFLIQH